MKKLLEKTDYIFNKLQNDSVSEYAAECAYFTILSFIPFIIFFLTLIQFTNVDKESIYFWIREVIPTTMHNMILGVIDEVYSKSLGTISIAAIFALWSASKGFFYLSKGLRKIYKSKEQKINVIMRIEGVFYTFIFVIAIISFLVVMVLGNRIHQLFAQKFRTVAFITAYILKIRGFILVIAMFIVFLLIYKFIPRKKNKFKNQIYGALFASVGWYLTSWIFSIYINLFEGFSNTYGSLTSIILIMMWVYVCMYIILLGAEINTFVEEYRKCDTKSEKINIFRKNT